MEPLDAGGMTARDLAGRFLARARRSGLALLLAGLALAAGGFAGFGVYSDRASSLQKHGTHVTATVAVAALYTGRYSRNSFTQHIEVDFHTPDGALHRARIPIGETDRFRVGQQVEIAYDPASPKHAVLGHGYADIGPVGFPLFFAIVIGACLAIVGIRALRLGRRGRRALREGARTMAVRSGLLPRGRTTRCALSLTGEGGEQAQLWASRRRGWYPLAGPVEATVFGTPSPGSVVVVADPERGAVTAGHVWKRPRLPFSAAHLPAVSPALWQGLLAAVAAAGLATSVACAVWVVRLGERWQESKHVQAGPQVPATIVSVGKVSGSHQAVTLRYEDSAGAEHLLELRFPLGLASSVLPGRTTTVSYDPHDPARAELTGHPRGSWQTFAFGLAALAGLCVLVLWAALAFRNGLHREPAHRHHLAAGFFTVLGLLAAGARIVLALVHVQGTQVLAFPPNPPPPAAARAAPLPALLSAPPPRRGPLVTPAQAHRVADAVWPLRDRALAARDLATVRALEAGPALAVDAARMRSGDPPDRPNPPPKAPAGLAVYVPRQTAWPLRFLAEGLTTSAGQRFVEYLIFARASARARWHVVYDTGYAQGNGAAIHVDPGILDRQGYDVVPRAAEIAAADAVPDLARYWQAWLEDGTEPDAVPPFQNGYWTSEYGTQVSGTQDEPGSNGHPAHTVYGDRPAPADEVWTFGVYDDLELVCSPMHQTTVWTGTAHQDEARSKWGPDLAPGAYSRITADVVREPCVLVPPSGALIAFGADRWLVGLRGGR